MKINNREIDNYISLNSECDAATKLENFDL